MMDKLKKDKKTTGQKLSKIPNVPCLYRHENGNYYGIKKHRGKIVTVALKNDNGLAISDRKMAENVLRKWMAKLDSPAYQNGATFEQVYERFLETKKGKTAKTIEGYNLVKFWFKKYDKNGLLNKPIDSVKPSDLKVLFSALPCKDKWSDSTFNRFTMVVNQVCRTALCDGLIAFNPCDRIEKDDKRRNNGRKPDEVPTIEECEKLVLSIRSQKAADTREESANKLAFIHLSALGTAEVNNIVWGDIKFETGVMQVLRKKTTEYFEVPIYDHLNQFLYNLYERQGKPAKNKRVFNVADVKKGLYNACKRLGLPAYSPRDFRKARIVWMLRKGVGVETIAKWQGHQDNGVLIRRTYAWVIDSAQKEFEKEELKKLA